MFPKEAHCTERIQFNEIEKTRLEVELKTANDNYKIMKENTAYKIQKYFSWLSLKFVLTKF